MAKVPRCILCEKLDFPLSKCQIYKDGIPQRIFLEYEECPSFKRTAYNGDEELPIAKGR